MAQQRGSLDRVTVTQQGAALADAAAVGDDILLVDWTVDFDEFGGGLSLNGATLGYTDWDYETQTLTLAAPLVTAAEQGDQVLSLAPDGVPRQETVAWVRLADGEEPLPFAVHSDLQGRLTELTETNTAVIVDLGREVVIGTDAVTLRIDPDLIGVPTMFYMEGPPVGVTSTTPVPIDGLETVLTSPGEWAVWQVEINGDVSISAGGSVNAIQPRVDALALPVTLVTSGPTGMRVTGTRKWRIDSLPAGDHDLDTVTRNGDPDSATTVHTQTTLALTRVR